jgi:hypothetical protein
MYQVLPLFAVDNSGAFSSASGRIETGRVESIGGGVGSPTAGGLSRRLLRGSGLFFLGESIGVLINSKTVQYHPPNYPSSPE